MDAIQDVYNHTKDLMEILVKQDMIYVSAEEQIISVYLPDISLLYRPPQTSRFRLIP